MARWIAPVARVRPNDRLPGADVADVACATTMRGGRASPSVWRSLRGIWCLDRCYAVRRLFVVLESLKLERHLSDGLLEYFHAFGQLSNRHRCWRRRKQRIPPHGRTLASRCESVGSTASAKVSGTIDFLLSVRRMNRSTSTLHRTSRARSPIRDVSAGSWERPPRYGSPPRAPPNHQPQTAWPLHPQHAGHKSLAIDFVVESDRAQLVRLSRGQNSCPAMPAVEEIVTM